MSNPLPTIPYYAAVLDENGLLTQEWTAFFRGLYIRVGAANALSNLELQALTGGASLQASLTALTNTVSTNQTSDAAKFNDFGQGPNL